MATNPQNQAEGNYDPAGSTQMFRAFVDEGSTPQAAGGRRAPAPQQSAGPRVGIILGVIVAILAVAGAVWLALS
ncbi:hypothetical protein SSP35_03_05470 [Streptomyces sp. NBRC 110611]|uniref:hypothetical protein n=1 Tax=Streptomyces sp. NBRC 110611 TaxID=1621259 RepID=UPI00082C9956|nr:hypothetical protein [Streptomyces sp. NBRC 110611]GAU66898.1 hypothetical protein SSP35_03_05470 [Streptomyces sp. NBRC 110611]